jgi:sugar phosphate isomerase/epimerase
MFEKEFSRREFGKMSLLAGALGLTRTGLAQKKKLPIGLQLYTLRDLMKDDFKGTIEKVAKIGYSAVEFAGYGNLTAIEISKLLNDLGLKCCGSHEGYDNLVTATIDKTIEFNKAIGNTYVVCPSMPGEFREKGADGIKAFADDMNIAGEKIKKAGMHLCYHNHDFEFKMVENKTLYDLLLERADAKLVMMEIDTYWVKYANVDPMALIKRLKGRCPLLHMKDMTKTEPPTFAPVGMGMMDIKGIVKAGRNSGTVWYIVEQDRCQGPALEAVSFSFANLTTIVTSN